MDSNEPEMPSPEVCASKIFEISGTKFEPEIAVDLWPKILQHKWLMSEKLHRDVGLRTACTDFLEKMEQALKEFMDYKRRDILAEMGAQRISSKVWDTISDFPASKAARSAKNYPSTHGGRTRQKARRYSPEDDHFLWSAWHRENPFCEGNSRHLVLVVY